MSFGTFSSRVFSMPKAPLCSRVASRCAFKVLILVHSMCLCFTEIHRIVRIFFAQLFHYFFLRGYVLFLLCRVLCPWLSAFCKHLHQSKQLCGFLSHCYIPLQLTMCLPLASIMYCLLLLSICNWLHPTILTLCLFVALANSHDTYTISAWCC